MRWGRGRFFFPASREVVGNPEHPIWSREPDRTLWMLLCRDAHDQDGEDVVVTYANLIERTAHRVGRRRVEFTRKALRAALHRLARHGFVAVPHGEHLREQAGARGQFVVTVVNYDSYRLRSRGIGHTSGHTIGNTPDRAHHGAHPGDHDQARHGAHPGQAESADPVSDYDEPPRASGTRPGTPSGPASGTPSGTRLERVKRYTPPYPPTGGAAGKGRKARTAEANDVSDWVPPERRVEASA